MDSSSIFEKMADKAVWAVLAFVAGGAFFAVRAWASRTWKKQKTGRADGTQFTLLVAELDGDADHTQTRHILAELEKQFPPRGEARLHVLPYPEALKPGPGERTAALLAAEERGRRWLKDKNADVLIWGEVGAKDKVLRLRFTASSGGGGQKPYEMNSALELPPNFGADLGAVLAAQAATAISPVHDRQGEAVSTLLLPIVAKLKPLAENPPASFGDETRAQLWEAYAAGEARVGEERGDNVRLATAITIYNKVLTIWTRDKVPLGWATTQLNLGSALARLGERESCTARLDEAAEAFRAALLVYERDKYPQDWAGTLSNLGLALVRLGERESGTARLEEAVEAFRAALLENTRDKAPLNWAMTQNNLGLAHERLGERESGTARLEEAVTAFRAALLEYTRDKIPLNWALTQNNLALALLRLGERESGSARLEEAVEAFRAALLEYTHDKVPLDWAMTQNNLGIALVRLGERRCRTRLFEEATEAFRAALLVYMRDNVPLNWAMTQNNLGLALARCGEQESGTLLLEEAVAAFRAALLEQTREDVPLDWAMTQNNLGLALAMLQNRQVKTDNTKCCETLKAARECFVAALQEYERAGASHYVEMVQGNIARIDGVITGLGDEQVPG